MKKQWALVIICTLIVGFIVGCGGIYGAIDEETSSQSSTFGFLFGEANGNVVGQERELDGFNNVALDGTGSVNIHTGKEYKVVITTDSNLQDKIITKVDNNTLHIGENERTNQLKFINSKNLTVDVYMPELKNVSLNGFGDIKLHSANASELNLSLSGIGNIDAKNYKAENVNVSLYGFGDISVWATKTLKGDLSGMGSISAGKHKVENASVSLSGFGDISVWATKTLKGDLSGMGSISAGKHKVENVSVSLSGFGDISVWATKTLKGDLSGMGSISYKGNPTIKELTNTGFGNIDGG